MVIADIGDHGQFGSQDVGGVESSAKADLYDGDVDVLPREVVKGERGD